jgi:hypothetical protein
MKLKAEARAQETVEPVKKKIIIITQILGVTSLFQCSEILKPSCHLLLGLPTFPVLWYYIKGKVKVKLSL